MWVTFLFACRPVADAPVDGGQTDSVVSPTGDTSVGETKDPDPPLDLWPSRSGFTLLAPLQVAETHLLDGEGDIVFTWVHDAPPGVATELGEGGELIRTVAVEVPDTFSENRGGLGGAVQILAPDGTVSWRFDLATDRQLLHHDFEQLPNGNLLLNSLAARDEAEVIALGRDPALVGPLGAWGEEVLEVCRQGPNSTCIDSEIVWRWSVWDHVVQDRDPGAPNYVSDVDARPDAVDIDGNAASGVPDWMHVNAVDYDASLDRILLSVRELDEVWIIDRASGSITARWGDGVLFGQHDAHFIADGLSGAGNVLLFNNGSDRPGGPFSSVEEWCVPPTCPDPVRTWVYEEGPDGDLYASNLSSAQRLSSGSTWICEGPSGEMREVDAKGAVIWRGANPLDNLIARSLFRAPHHEVGDPRLQGLGL